jgi:ERCC4-type nuclease
MANTEPEPTFLIDSREQRPFRFNGPTRVVGLPTGDYSLEGYQDEVAVERKQLDDLIMCLSSQRDRFKRELERARDFDYFCVLVEAPFSDLVNQNYISRMNPHSAVESISAFEVRYRIPFLFCGTQALAARKCESLLRKYYREKMIELDNDVPF